MELVLSRHGLTLSEWFELPVRDRVFHMTAHAELAENQPRPRTP